MSYELFEYKDITSQLWDDFVRSQGSGSIHQISTWKTFQEQIPGRDQVLGFGLKHEDEIIVSCLCVKREVGFKNKFWFYSPRGPVFKKEVSQEALDYFIKEVSKKLKAVGGMFWRLDPFLSNNPGSHEPGLKIRNSRPATQQYQPTDSLVLDITLSEEEILAQMKRKGRYNIKLAREKDVKIEIIEHPTQEQIDSYWDLSQETAGRDGFQTHDKAYHEKFITQLKPYTVLAFAKYEGKIIAGVINTYCGDKAIYYFGASSGDRDTRPLMAPYLLQWEMIRYGKSKGCKTYDFTGITPENEPNHPYKGITQFKEKFGGQRATYQAAREIPLQKTWYWVYKIVKYLRK